MASGEVGPDDADPLARLERGEEDWGDIGGGDDALSELEGAFHPVTVDGADHLNGSLGLVLWGKLGARYFQFRNTLPHGFEIFCRAKYFIR